MIKNKRILYFIQMPPPVHGVSITNQLVFNIPVINNVWEKKLIRINFSSEIEELRKFSLKKLGVFIITLLKLIWTLLRFRPDIIYFSLIPVGSGFIRDAAFALTMKLFKNKVIYHLNNRGISECKTRKLYNKLYKWVFNHSTIIHVSKGLLQKEILNLNLTNIKTFVVGNTIKSFTRESRQKKNQKVQILFLSNYFPEKGLRVLLEAILILKEKTEEIHLNTYGAMQNRGEYLRWCKFVEENDLSSYITIHGPVYDLEKAKVFAEADIFVFPSYFIEECFPLTILEAMNAKLPVIATRIGAIPEIIKDGEEGYLVNPHNPQELSGKIETLVLDPSLRKSLGQNAYKKFIENY